MPTLSIRSLIRGHGTKLRKAQLEKIALHSAVCLNIQTEVAGVVSIPVETLDAEWGQTWAAGGPSIDADISSALDENETAFDPQSLPSLKSVTSKHLAAAPIASLVMVDAKAQLVRDEFDLVVKNSNYDLDAMTVWRAKYTNHDNTVWC